MPQTFALLIRTHVDSIPIAAKEPVKLEGIEVISWSVVPPQGGYGTLALGVVSYASAVVLTVSCDKGASRSPIALVVPSLEPWLMSGVLQFRDVKGSRD